MIIKSLLFVVLLASICHLTNGLDRMSYLKCGEQLWVGQFLESNDYYFAIVQSDCNFVIYSSKHFVKNNQIWSSGTVRADCYNPRLVNQKDGNVVLYSGSKQIWSSNTYSTGVHCYKLIMQEDGNLVLYSQAGSELWSTGSNA